MFDYNNMLNLGNGISSMAQQYDLLHKLDECFELLGGWQQPAHRRLTGKEERQRKLDEIFIRMFIKDVAMALTGDRIEFIRE